MARTLWRLALIPDRPAVPLPIATVPATREPRRPSPVVVVMMTALLVGGYFMLQNTVAVAILLPRVLSDLAQGHLAVDRLAAHFSERVYAELGLLAWLGVAIGAPAVAAAVWGIARWLFGRAAFARRLGLVLPRLRDALLWLLALVAFGLLWERFVVWLDRPPMPDVMHQIFTTAGWLPGLVVSVVVLAPLTEELIFRGFCLGGLAPIGGPAAIGVSAVFFALIHLQYDWVDMSGVLALGLLFGAARWHTGSTVLACGLHLLHNGMATAQALWIVSGEGG